MRATKDRTFYFEIFAISLTAVLLEVSWTRVFSFKLYYYFSYLVIGLSLLGLGSGAVLVSIFPRIRSAQAGAVVVGCCLMAGAAVVIGLPAHCRHPLSFLGLEPGV